MERRYWHHLNIRETQHAAEHNVGAVLGSEYKGIFGSTATFNGQSVANADVLVKYTWYGDSDLSGEVDFDDYVRTDAGFNTQGDTWFEGDFDYSGLVDFDDYVLIDLGFNTQSGTVGPGPGRGRWHEVAQMWHFSLTG